MGPPGIRAWEHLRVALPMRRPGVQWHVREELGQRHGEIHLDVRETYDLHVSYRQSTFWHECPPCRRVRPGYCPLMSLQAGAAATTEKKLPLMGVTCSRLNPALRNRVANSCSVRSLPPKVT